MWINTYQMVYPSVPVRRREAVRPRPHPRRDLGRGDDHGEERVDGGALMSATAEPATAAGSPRRRRRDLPLRVLHRHVGREGAAGRAGRRPVGAVRQRRSGHRRRRRRRVDRRGHRGSGVAAPPAQRVPHRDRRRHGEGADLPHVVPAPEGRPGRPCVVLVGRYHQELRRGADGWQLTPHRVRDPLGGAPPGHHRLPRRGGRPRTPP